MADQFVSYKYLKAQFSLQRRQIQDDLDALRRGIPEDIKTSLGSLEESFAKRLTDFELHIKDTMRLYTEATINAIVNLPISDAPSEYTFGGVLKAIQKKLPNGSFVGTGNRNGEPDWLNRSLGQNQSDDVYGLCMAAIGQYIDTHIPTVKIPNLKEQVKEAMATGIVDTVKHNSDMRGTDDALKSIPRTELNVNTEDVERIAQCVIEKLKETAPPKNVRLCITEYNQLNQKPIEDVFVWASQENEFVASAMTDANGVAMLELLPGEYKISKKKAGWTFTDQKVVI